MMQANVIKKVEDKTYNGWKNYETWNVKLWIDNDQGESEYWNDHARDFWKAHNGDKNDAAYMLAEQLKSEYEERSEEVLKDHSATVWADLLGAALSEVDWYEIAEAIITDLDLETEE